MIAMINKSVARTAVILLLISLAAIEVEVVDANPIPWNYKPNLDKPTISIDTPKNNVGYKESIIPISFNVTKPDSWKIHMVVPYVGVIASVNAYLDGYNIYYVHDGKGQYYFSKEFNFSNSGLHSLNITVLSYSYYTGPAYNNSHILSNIQSSDGPIYQYPIVVSKTVYFTANGEPFPSLPPTPTTTVPEFPAPLAVAFLVLTALAVAVVLKRKHLTGS